MIWPWQLHKKETIDEVLRQCREKRTADSGEEFYNALFLDYDGVINVDWHNPDDYPFEKHLVENVNTLCHMFDLRIVISSSWRTFNGYQDYLIRSGLADDIQIIGKTEHLGLREDEIKHFLLNNPYILRFIILDDMPMPSFKQYQVMTRYPDGFDERKLQEAITLLKQQKPNI